MTREEVLALKSGYIVHAEPCRKIVGKRGGVTTHMEVWRVSGQVKTWKRDPDRFQVPIKHGMYDNGYIDQHNYEQFHRERDCPLNQGE